MSTSLVEAVQSGNVTEFIRLANSGADIYECDADGHSLRWHAEQAAATDILDVIAMLEDAYGRKMDESKPAGGGRGGKAEAKAEGGAPADSEELQACLAALRKMRPRDDASREAKKALLRMLQQGDIMDEDDKGKSALQYACLLGAQESIDYLLAQGVPLDADDEGTLLMAVASGHVALVRHLMLLGADMDVAIRGRTPLEHAAEAGAVELVLYLLDNGAAGYPLHVAVSKNRLETVNALMEHGGDIQEQDASGATPLARAQTLEMAIHLVEVYGADVHAKDAEGYTILESALGMSECSADMLRYLCEQGASLCESALARDYLRGALCSTGESCVDRVSLLLELGVPARCKADDGEEMLNSFLKSLHIRDAGSRDKTRAALEKVGLLIRHGADVNVSNLEGRTPLNELVHNIVSYERTWDKSVSTWDVARYLRRQGARMGNCPVGEKMLEWCVRNHGDERAQRWCALLLESGVNACAKSKEYEPSVDLLTLLVHKVFEWKSEGWDGWARAGFKMVQLFVEHGADVNADGSSSLRECCSALEAKVMRGMAIQMANFLSHHGARLKSVSDSVMRRYLHDAIVAHSPEMLSILLEEGVDVNAPYESPLGGKRMPLDDAYHERCQPIIDMLEARGARRSWKNRIFG